MSLLNFLKTSTIEEVTKSSAGRPAGGARKQWNPAPAIVAIRLWKDGSVFPSDAAVAKFELEYRNTTILKEKLPLKEGQTEADQKYRNVYNFAEGPGYGLDVIDSRLWPQMKAAEGAMLFAVPVVKDAGKVDLFNTVAYDAEGKPKFSVKDQGSATFGIQVLIPAVEEIYGVKFNRAAKEADEDGPAVEAITDGVDFVDLAIIESLGTGEEAFNITENFSKPIIFAPKRINRGPDKGKADYERRENVKVYGLVPAAQVIEGYVAGTGDKVEEEVGGNNTENQAGTTEA